MADTKRVIIIDLEVETNKYIKSIADARKEVALLEQENKKLKETLRDAGDIGSASWNRANKALIENESNLRKAKTSLNGLQKDLDNLEQKYIDQQKAQEDNAKAEKKAQEERAEANRLALEQAQELEEAIQVIGDTTAEALGESPEQEGLFRNITNTKQAIAELTANNERLKQGLKGVAVGSEEYNKINTAVAKNEAQLRQARGELNNYQRQLDNISKANNASAGSYEQLYRRYLQAEVQLKTLANTLKINADGTVELTAEYQKAQQQVLNLKDGLLKFNSGIKDGRLNVGNYTQSFQQAIQGFSGFGGAIGQVTGAIQTATSVFQLAQQGSKLIADGFESARQSISAFSVSVEESNDTFASSGEGLTNVTGGLNEVSEATQGVTESLEQTGEAGKQVGEKINSGSIIGANGTKILKIGLQSIGIGLIITAVTALIGYFSKFQAGIDKLKIALASVNSFFESVVGSIVQIGQAIASLDFTKAIDGFKNIGTNAIESANATAQLERAKIRLEERDIENIAIQDELNDRAVRSRLLAEDKTKTDAERISLIEQANESELQLLNTQLAREREALRIAESEVAIAKKKKQETREQLKALEELRVKVGDVEDAIFNKQAQTLAETGKLRKQFNADRINSEVAILNDQLKLAQLNGDQAFSLQKQIAKRERDAKLEDTQLSADQREAIESAYRVRIAEINKAILDDTKRIQEQVTDARLNTIVDGLTRELAIESEALRRKLEQIKGNSQQEKQLREALITESTFKAIEIQEKYAQQTLDQQQQLNDQQTQLAVDGINQRAEASQRALTLATSEQLTNAQLTAEQREQIEFDSAQRSLQIEEDRLNDLLAIQTQQAVTRIANEKQFFDEQENLIKENLANRRISQKDANDQLVELAKQRTTTEATTEAELQSSINQTVQAINENRLQQTTETNRKITEDNQRTLQAQLELQRQTLDAVSTLFSSFAQLLATDETNRRKNAGVLKALAKGEIIIGAYKEIAGYWEGAGKDTARTGVVGGVGATILASILSATAIARAIANVSKVNAQQFASGGFTVGDAIAQYNPMLANGMTGGFVSSPTMWQSYDGGMKLAGEKGTEYVSPYWQIKQAPSLFSALENWRRTGVKPFADGGFTTSTITQPIVDTAQSLEVAIAKGFASAPTPVVAVTEINEVQTRVSVIESRSSL